MMPPQGRVRFSVFVEVRGDGPGPVVVIEEEHHAFADVYEEANVTAAPREDLVYTLKNVRGHTYLV